MLPLLLSRKCREVSLLCLVATLGLGIARGWRCLIMLPGCLLMECSRGKCWSSWPASHLLYELQQQHNTFSLPPSVRAATATQHNQPAPFCESCNSNTSHSACPAVQPATNSCNSVTTQSVYQCHSSLFNLASVLPMSIPTSISYLFVCAGLHCASHCCLDCKPCLSGNPGCMD